MSIQASNVYEALVSAGVDFFVGVPDSVLRTFIAAVSSKHPSHLHVTAANEGNAIGLAAGRYLATGRPAAVYLQNSGLGNAVNPLLSLVDTSVYAIPMVLLVGWRGEPGVSDEPQHLKTGAATPGLLDVLDIPHWVHDAADAACADISRAVQSARQRSGPAAVLFRKNAFGKESAGAESATAGETLPSREEALVAVLDSISTEDVLVASTGTLARELYAQRLARKERSELDFLNVGAMGHCSSIAAGIAAADPHRRIICLDGDGALLMHLGALPVIAGLRPRNLVHVVLNNASHDSVGGQPTMCGQIELTQLARVAGYASTFKVSKPAELSRLLSQRQMDAPVLIDVRIRKGFRSDLPRPADPPAVYKQRFMQALKVEIAR